MSSMLSEEGFDKCRIDFVIQIDTYERTTHQRKSGLERGYGLSWISVKFHCSVAGGKYDGGEGGLLRGP
jgi:hypothetical protein